MFFHKHDFNSFRSEDSRQYLLKPKGFINLSCFLSIYLSLSLSLSLSLCEFWKCVSHKRRNSENCACLQWMGTQDPILRI